MLAHLEQLLDPGMRCRYESQHCRPSSGRKSQRDSLQSNPTFEFHLQIWVPPDKLKPAQMAPHTKK